MFEHIEWKYMSDIRYLSLFSGIGGLEHKYISPLLYCEQDSACQDILHRRHPNAEIIGDIRELVAPPQAEIVVGGWPCQDLSSAGVLGGINGSRSGLFFDMVRVAKACGAHTLVGENVPNLLSINKGTDFQIVIDTLIENGYANIAWRVLNARSFGLPQERRRLFIIASKEKKIAESLHSALPDAKVNNKAHRQTAYGFYWTAGKRSICFSSGYAPTLKIGATDERGRAPVAVFYNGHVRKLSPKEFLQLQGFTDIPIKEMPASTLLRMAGNAVAVPVGQFVVDAAFNPREMEGYRSGFGMIKESGIWEDGFPWEISHDETALAENLIDFIDINSQDSLSAQAAAGLIVRSVRSGQLMPLELFDALWELTLDRTQKIKASRANSIEAIDSMEKDILDYRGKLSSISSAQF